MILVNFGGPRNLEEIAPFLEELLCDKDVVRTSLPHPLHRFLFKKAARRRAKKIAPDYEKIGGKSPIFFDTEAMREKLEESLKTQVLSFHRYLPMTHRASLEAIENCKASTLRVVPLFPQFTFATSGSIARFFSRHLSVATLEKLRWIKSFPDHPQYIACFQNHLKAFLETASIPEEKTLFLFSAHGLPKAFVDEGDPYEEECTKSFLKISSYFPKASSLLCYQSKFGRGKWLEPYTQEVSENISRWNADKQHIVFIPISFTSDHIETLFEVEHQYMPILRKQNRIVHRCPALNLSPRWIEALASIAQESRLVRNEELIR